MTKSKKAYEKSAQLLKEWRQNHAVHTQRMQEVLAAAQKAHCAGEVPVAASLWCASRRIALAHNMVEAHNDPMMHAEYIVVRRFVEEEKEIFLENCILYVSLFPCSMCVEFLRRMRLYGLCYGASPPEGPVGDAFPFVLGGVLYEQCANLLQGFFSQKR